MRRQESICLAVADSQGKKSVVSTAVDLCAVWQRVKGPTVGASPSAVINISHRRSLHGQVGKERQSEGV